MSAREEFRSAFADRRAWMHAQGHDLRAPEYRAMNRHPLRYWRAALVAYVARSAAECDTKFIGARWRLAARRAGVAT